jgi:hypothetical protein
LEKLRPNTSREHYEKRKKTSLFISLCILRDLSQQKIPRELGGVGDPAIFLCSHVPMERFFDGTDQENSKTQGGKGHSSRKIFKNKKERMKERKRKRFFTYMEVPILIFSPSVRNILVRPSMRRTLSYGDLPINQVPFLKTRQTGRGAS